MSTSGSGPRVLAIRNGGRHFDGVRAVDDVTLEVNRGEVVGLIGPNGSGKTTTLNMLSGTLRPTEGEVLLDGVPITRHSIRKRVRAGVSRTFQSVRVFDRLTVAQNVEVAALGCGASRREATATVGRVLTDLRLRDVADLEARAIPAGMVRKVGIARALASSPSFLLLDEPAAGQNETEAVELIESISEFATQRGLGVLLVEHDMTVVMNTCDRLHVLDSGRTLATGLPSVLKVDPRVIEIYFGKGR